jgi:hypothetical protein
MLYDRSRAVAAFIPFLLCMALDAGGATPPYGWPLRVERIITSSFGEFREGHVHAGLDFSTGGREGLPVYAVADGCVERLRCSPFGYGKAIYVRLDDGRTAVYAHLSDYSPKLRRLVTDAQSRSLKYETDLWVKAGSVRVRSGDVVGYSGSTGTGAPHLHFEMRGKDGCPLNPFEFYPAVPDSVAPEFGSVAVTPLDDSSRVDGLPIPAIVPVEFNAAQGRYMAVRPVTARGRIGIAVETIDRGGKGPYKRGVHMLEAYADGKPLFSVRNDKFCYERGRQVYLTYEFSLLRRGGRRFLKTYRDVGNTLSSYQRFRDGPGHLEVADTAHTVTVAATDDIGNRSEVTIDIVPEPMESEIAADAKGGETSGSTGRLDCTADFWPNAVVFTIKSTGLEPAATPTAAIEMSNGERVSLDVHRLSSTEYRAHTPLHKELDGRWAFSVDAGEGLIGEWSYNLTRIAPAEGGRIVSEDGVASVKVPSGGLYRSVYGRANVETGKKNGGAGTVVGKVYNFGPVDEPLASRSEVDIECPAGESTDGLALCYRNGNGNWHFLSRYGTPAGVYELGTFALVRDDQNPEVDVKSPVKNGAAAGQPLRVEVTLQDEPAGIDLDSVRTELDGKPIVCEYHPPSSSLRYRGETPLAPGQHTFSVTVRDNVENETRRDVSFTVSGNAP